MKTEKATTVIVPDYQLSLAIGKRGQNARLAAKLTGWKIDIKSETDAREAGIYPREETLLSFINDEEDDYELMMIVITFDIDMKMLVFDDKQEER